MAKKSIIYTRVSTTSQAEKELPLESQLQACIRKSVELGCDSYQHLSDAAETAASADRPGFQEAIRQACVNRYDYFICWSTSRFVRNRDDAFRYKQALSRHKVKLVFCSINMDDSDPLSQFLVNGVYELLDELQLKIISRDTLRSIRENAKNGYSTGGTATYGYKSVIANDDPKKKRLVIDDAEADIVRLVFEYRLNNYGYRSISKMLNHRGIKKRGNSFTANSIAYMLKNPRYIGLNIVNRANHRNDEKIECKGPPAIIDESIFNKVQALIKASTRSFSGSQNRSVWIFSGLLVCHNCGNKLQLEGSTGRSKRYWYFDCRKNQRDSFCDFKRIRADHLESQLIESIAEKIINANSILLMVESLKDEIKASKAANSKKINLIKRQIEAKEEACEHLLDLIERPEHESNISSLMARYNANKKTIETLINDIDDLKSVDLTGFSVSKDQAVLLADDLREKLFDPSRKTQAKEMIRQLIEQVVVGPSITIEFKRDFFGVNGASNSTSWGPRSRTMGTSSITVTN